MMMILKVILMVMIFGNYDIDDDDSHVDVNLQHFVGARLDSRHKMSGTERNLLHL